MVTCGCQPMHRGQPVDVGALNPRVPYVDRGARFAWAIVPGYTPRLGWQRGLHPKARARLDAALVALARRQVGALIVSGGAVHSADNEAVLMREYVLERGVDPARVVVEPCARHTTTNLRNAGRLLLDFGHDEALVITSDRHDVSVGRLFEQAFYVGRPWLSGFHTRCLLELGYLVGELDWLATGLVRFRPSPRVRERSWKETLMGDP